MKITKALMLISLAFSVAYARYYELAKYENKISQDRISQYCKSENEANKILCNDKHLQLLEAKMLESYENARKRTMDKVDIRELRMQILRDLHTTQNKAVREYKNCKDASCIDETLQFRINDLGGYPQLSIDAYTQDVKPWVGVYSLQTKKPKYMGRIEIRKNNKASYFGTYTPNAKLEWCEDNNMDFEAIDRNNGALYFRNDSNADTECEVLVKRTLDGIILSVGSSFPIECRNACYERNRLRFNMEYKLDK